MSDLFSSSFGEDRSYRARGGYSYEYEEREDRGGRGRGRDRDRDRRRHRGLLEELLG